MAFTAIPSVVTGQTYSASNYNTYIKGNFEAIWVLTTAGDLMYATSPTVAARLGIGASGSLLRSTGSAPAWLAPGAAGRSLVMSGGIPAWVDAVPGLFAAAGDLVYGSAADTPAKLALGAAFTMLRSNLAAAAPEWGSVIYRRQGGDATDWDVQGGSNYTPPTCLLQAGVIRVLTSSGGANSYGTATINFPYSYGAIPLVLLTLSGFASQVGKIAYAHLYSVSTVSQAYVEVVSNSTLYNYDVNWLALGIPS